MKKATPRAGGKGGQGLLDESFELPLARSALLVIDVQNDFLGLSADCKAILKPLQGLMKTFRERHLPVIHTLYYHGLLRYPGVKDTRYCLRGTDGAKEPKESATNSTPILRSRASAPSTRPTSTGSCGTAMSRPWCWPGS